MKKKYDLLKVASWYTVGNILVKGISFFLLPVFTSLMTTRDYGIYSIYASYLSIFEVVILLGMSATVRIAKYTDDLDFEEYISTITKIPLILMGIFIIIINIYFIFNVELFSMRQELWNCLLITSTSSAILQIISARLVIEGRYGMYMLYSVGNTLANVGLSLLLCYTVYQINDMYMARVIGSMIPNIIFAIVFSIAFVKKSFINTKLLKMSLQWGIPLLIHTTATVIFVQVDRILIKIFSGYENAGIYSIAVTVVAIPMVLQTSFESAWAPWFYEKLKNKEYTSICKVNNGYIFIFAIIIAEFMIVSPEIIHWFTNEAYWEGVYSLIPLSMGIFIEVLYCITVNIEYYNKKTWMITQGTLIVLFLNVFLDILFIKLFGYIGAAYGTIISKMILFGIHWKYSKKIDKNSIFSKRYVFVTVFGLVLLNILLLYTVDIYLVRYILGILIMILLLVWFNRNKNEMMNILKLKE